MHFICPHCHAPIEAGSTAGEPVVCPSCGSSFPLTSSPTVVWNPTTGQRRLGRFELIDRVGTGAFSNVYKALDTELERIVAIKVPRTLCIDDDNGDRNRFFREGRNVARLRHPSIVSVHEVGEYDGTPYLVQDFVEGVTLADLLTGEQLPVRQVAELVATVADALQYAHDQGVVHRDVKPSNIMLEATCNGKGASGNGAHVTRYAPKLMDFGLSRRDEGEATVTLEGQVLGTPAYMSPEQARGEAHQVDGRSDVYSLGVILYQLLTQSLPFPGNARLQMYQVLHQEPPSPRKRQPTLPRDLETICLKAMVKTPEERYQTARDLAADLRRFLKGEPIQARRVNPLERAIKWGRRRPAALIVGTAILLVLVAAFILSRKPPANADVQIEYYAGAVRRWGALEGVGRLTESQMRRRYLSNKIYRRGGRVEKVEIVTGRGELSGIENYSHLAVRHGRSAYIEDVREPMDEPECCYEYRYDDRGQVTEEIASNAAGRIMWVFHYTAQGETTGTGQFTDARGFARPRAASGAAFVSITRTPEGWDGEIHYRDRRGRPAPIEDGSYGLRQEHDARGLPILQTLLDGQDRPFRGKNGYAAVRQEFDDLGQLREWTYLDVDGKLVPNPNGVARVRQTYDENGNVIEQACFGPDGRPAMHRDGFARITKTYDDHGSMRSWSLYGLDGKLTLHRRWCYAQSKFAVNERGLTVEQLFYGTDGRPTLTEPGIAKFINTYDEQGRQTSYASFGLDGQLVIDPRFGVAKTIYGLDAQGNRISEAYFGVDNKPIRCKAGFAKITRVFDDQGREIEWAFFGVDGRAVCLPDGYARGKRVYDPQGQEIELTYFGLDGKPVVTKDGYARLTRVYDDRGNVLEEAYFGPDGKPALAKSGVARLTRSYDDAGELTDVHYFDTAGRPTRLNFIRDWLVLAAIPVADGQSPASALTSAQVPGEACLHPRSGERLVVHGSPLVWKKVHAPEFFLDFNRVQGRLTEYSIGYAVCYLKADRERHGLVLKIGSDDQIAVHLNGQEILSIARPRQLTVDDDVLTNITLRRGINVLVVKVINETRDWSACVRLTDASGKRVPGVKVTLAW